MSLQAMMDAFLVAFHDYEAAGGNRTPAGGDHLDFHDGFTRPETFNGEFVLYYGSYKLLIDAEDVETISRHYRALGGVSMSDAAPAFRFLLDMLTTRLRHLRNDGRAQVISLGEDCLPRTVATRWGLKNPRILGELTCPFDLSVHPTPAVAELIHTGFAAYTDPSDVAFDDTLNHPVNRRLNVLWNHETGRTWAEDDFGRLKSTYARRIDNLLSYLKHPRPVALLYVSKPFEDAWIDRIAAGIAEASAGTAILAIVNGSPVQQLPSGAFTAGGLRVEHLHNPLPEAWYLWWFHEHFTAPWGHAWERRIVDWLEPLVT